MRVFALGLVASAASVLALACSSSSPSPAPAATSDAGAAPDPSTTDNGPSQTLPNGAPHAVKGNVLGLAGSGLVVQNNGGDDVAIASNGPFAFKTPVAEGLTYYVRVSQQPKTPEQLCTVASGIGTMGGADVTDVFVHCANAYAIQANVIGLTGAGLVLLQSGGDQLQVTQSGVATFATHVAKGDPYAVTVGQQPAGQTCVVTAGSGTVGDGDVTTPTVTCT